MSKRKRISIYAGLALLYLYLWIDGGTLGQVLALGGVATTLFFLVLHYSLSSVEDKKKKSSDGSNLRS